MHIIETERNGRRQTMYVGDGANLAKVEAGLRAAGEKIIAVRKA